MMDISSFAERKSYLTEQFFFASSPVHLLRSITRLRRALVIISDRRMCSFYLLFVVLLSF